MCSVTIVLPCYNPPEKWVDNAIETFKKLGDRLGNIPALIVVNDGTSKDLSGAIEQLKLSVNNFTYLNQTVNKGKGAALRLGVAAAKTDCVVYTDIDFPYTVDSMVRIINSLIIEGNDVAIGVKDKNYYDHLPKARLFISKLLRRFIKLFFNLPITDTQCGLKGFKHKGKKTFTDTTIDRYLFDLEFVYQCFRNKEKLKIQAVEVTLRPNIVFRQMNAKILFTEGLNFLKILFGTQKQG